MLLEKKMAWTPERVETLKAMWSAGQSASQIALELGGITRNAVIGKIHRLGLSNRGTANTKEKKPAASKAKQDDKNSHKKAFHDKAPVSKRQANSENAKPDQDITKENFAGSENNVFLGANKSAIFNSSQALPPQSTTSEISEEILKNVKSVEKTSKKLSLMELTERTCKWPIGDPATEDFWFCGHPAEQGKPYCETHIEIAFQPVTTRRERKAR